MPQINDPVFAMCVIIVLFILTRDIFTDIFNCKGMTPQEISKFVEQPMPRKVPHRILRKVQRESSGSSPAFRHLFVLLLIMIYMLIPNQPILNNIVLDFGIAGKATAQGAIISITPTRLWSIGPTSYSLGTRFRPPGWRDITTVSYVWRRESIPGWGVIPETQDNLRLMVGETLSLAEPFPVTVEYIPGRPWNGRAAGTWFPGGIIELILAIVVFYIVILAHALFSGAQETKQLLRNGVFTTGYISEQKNSSPFTEHGQRPARYASDYIASFTDRSGVKREAFIVASSYTSWLWELANYEQPIGLLYLPDTNAVIVPNLWLATSPVSLADKYAKEEASFQERTKNMTRAEIKADQEKIEAEIMKELDKSEPRLLGNVPLNLTIPVLIAGLVVGFILYHFLLSSGFISEFLERWLP